MRFFKKIQDRILKSERIRKCILRFFTKQINPRSFGSWCVKGTGESTSRLDSSVPLTHHDPKDLGLICLVKKRKRIHFRILSDFRIQSWIFLGRFPFDLKFRKFRVGERMEQTFSGISFRNFGCTSRGWPKIPENRNNRKIQFHSTIPARA